MRGMLVKMCQVVGTRSDIFPPQYVKTLSQCHDRLPQRDFAAIRQVVEEDFGRPFGEVFSEFSPTAIAAASLAQVHKARLVDGRVVAVKVQYPDIEHIIRTDLTASRRVAAIYQRFDSNPMDFLPLLDELQRHLKMELDFRREAQSAERVRGFFVDDPTVRIPEILHEHCTRRVITMEYVEGVKVNDREALEKAGIEYSDLMVRLMRIFNQMILAHGFFHADPHPGNILVNRSPRGKALFTLLDFGLAKELPEGFGLGMFELMFSMMTFNESAMLRAFRELGFETKTERRLDAADDRATDDLAIRYRRVSGRVHRRHDRRDVRGDPRESGREGADRFRAGGARLCAVVGHRAHAGSARQRARCDGTGRRGLIDSDQERRRSSRRCVRGGSAGTDAHSRKSRAARSESDAPAAAH